MKDALLVEIQEILGRNGNVRLTWDILNQWCLIARSNDGYAFAGKDPSLENLVTRCIELITRTKRAKEPERTDDDYDVKLGTVRIPEPIRKSGTFDPDIIVMDDGYNLYSIMKNCFGPPIIGINITALSLVLSDIVDRKGSDLQVLWQKKPERKGS
jgi:hypothetical protein